MKNRFIPIMTFTLAVLLVGSIAYAAEKKKKTRQVVPEPNEMSEETLRNELMAATEDQNRKASGQHSSSAAKNAVHISKVKMK